MSALDRLEKLPDWPARMTAPVAAAYMGCSTNTFTSRFGRFGRKEGGNTYWSRAQLDQLILRQFDLQQVAPAPSSAYDSWKAGRQRA